MIKLAKTIKQKKRVGRGPGSGRGKTSGRGMNGQRSRTGSSTVFKGGGQTSYFMRLPKAKGFKKMNKNYTSINAKRLNGVFSASELVTAEELIKRLKLESVKPGIKIFGLGNLKEKLTFEDKILLAKAKNNK